MLERHPGDSEGEGADVVRRAGLSYETHPVESGSRSHYLSARIERDHPDVLQRCFDGEFVNVRQTAIAAGLVKEKDSGQETREQ
ncbi:MAG: hypothetical protein O7G88_08260 [bacterium]|nr:hypothetical protein [bacterium]